MTIVKVLVSMYLAGAILNAIQVSQCYCRIEQQPPRITDFLLFLAFVVVRPRQVIWGTFRAITNWNWLEGKIRKNDEGIFEVVKDGETDKS